LVHFEEFGEVSLALAREKQIKGWLRVKKITLIESVNPEWQDLSEGWYEKLEPISKMSSSRRPFALAWYRSA
jgi:hypothetical protein